MAPVREAGTSEGAPSLLSSSPPASTNRLLLLLARPPRMPWLAIHRESLIASGAESFDPWPAVQDRRCFPTSSRHCVGGWTSTRHTAPLVVVHGARPVWRHPMSQRHDHARPKDLEWRTCPRRRARTAGPRHPPSSYRSPTARLGQRAFRHSFEVEDDAAPIEQRRPPARDCLCYLRRSPVLTRRTNPRLGCRGHLPFVHPQQPPCRRDLSGRQVLNSTSAM